MNRRPALALAAVLAATVLTGGAAILGIARTAHPHPAPAVVQTMQPAAAKQSWDEGD
jgi:hypothetical protein